MPNAATNWQITNRALSIIHGHAATGLPCLALPDMATYNIIKIAKEISRKKIMFSGRLRRPCIYTGEKNGDVHKLKKKNKKCYTIQ